MDIIDRKICGILQTNARASSSDIAATVGLSVSTANDRARRLVAQGVVQGWHAALDPERVGADLRAFVMLDVSHVGEDAVCESLVARPEVMELHHISGAHSYLMKLRVADTRALQAFLRDVVKPLGAVQRTETILSLDPVKETMAVRIADAEAP